MATDYLSTPIGLLKIVANDDGLLSVKFIEGNDDKNNCGNIHTKTCKSQLKEYFDGKRETFELTIANEGTDFQKGVWRELERVPFGETATYKDIANKLANPKAVRAVGAANGKNPIYIIVPCHRIIGSNGALTGYAGGVDRKKWLLEHEKRV